MYTVLITAVFTIFTGITTFLFVTTGLWLKIMFLALNLVLTKKPRFAKHINGKIRQVNIKNWTYYFYNDRINLKDFDESLLKIDRKDYKDI